MLRGKNILSISPFILKPFIHGAITRIYYLNRQLSYDNRLTLVCRAPKNIMWQNDFNAINVSGGTSRYEQIFSIRLIIRLYRMFASNKPDFVLANHIWSGIHGVIFSKLFNVPLIFDDHNVEFIRFKRMQNPLWLGVRLLEKFIATNATYIFCVSEVDKLLLIEYLHIAPTKIQVVENGVDTALLQQDSAPHEAVRRNLNISPNVPIFIFFGSFTYLPNFQAAQVIISEIVPRLANLMPMAYILLVGNGPKPLEEPMKVDGVSILMLGFVDDLTSHIKASDVMIAPLQAGSGTRFKILEALACGVPVVTTPIGAEGIDRQVCGEHLAICEDWDSFTKKMIEQTQISSPLPTAFAERYDWENVVGRINV